MQKFSTYFFNYFSEYFKEKKEAKNALNSFLKTTYFQNIFSPKFANILLKLGRLF